MDAAKHRAVRGAQILAAARASLREFFLLEDAGRRSAATGAMDRESILAYYDAAQRRRAVANTLSVPAETPAGLILYRDACLCLIQAVLLATSREGNPSVEVTEPEAAWEAVNRVVDDWAPVPPADLECVHNVLVARDLLALDRFSTEKALRHSAALRAALQRLSRFVEPRSPLRIQRESRTRQALAVLAVCTLLVTFAVRWMSPSNLALNRPVYSSPMAFDTTAAAAVDGAKSERFGFHTQTVNSPQLTIDLEKTRDIAKVKVFGRGDCCFDQSLPLVLEVSTDGISFRQLAERTTAFSVSDPWIVQTGAREDARFVRLRGKREGALVLNEVEVYGRP
jgi:hypothetical protein